MPTYEYACEACNHELEVRQSITADPLSSCPKCHKQALHRKVGGGSATLQFKGSGFYLTDYCRKDEGSCPCSSNDSSKE